MTTGTAGVPDAAWFKSSYSGANETECLEAALLPGCTAVRDSKDRTGARLSFSRAAWAGFIAGIGQAQF
jgi:hypothetical protein